MFVSGFVDCLYLVHGFWFEVVCGFVIVLFNLIVHLRLYVGIHNLCSVAV